MVKHLLFQVQVLQEQVVVEVVGLLEHQVLRGHQQVAQVVVELVEDIIKVHLPHQHINHKQYQVAQTLEVVVVLEQKVVLVDLEVQA